jgi:hypothetical protein
MYPHERSLVKRLESKPFALIGVNSDADRNALKEVLVKEQITWRSFFEGSTSGPIARAWGVDGWPTLYVIDTKGVIRFRFAGAREQELDRAVETLLKEAEAVN